MRCRYSVLLPCASATHCMAPSRDAWLRVYRVGLILSIARCCSLWCLVQQRRQRPSRHYFIRFFSICTHTKHIHDHGAHTWNMTATINRLYVVIWSRRTYNLNVDHFYCPSRSSGVKSSVVVWYMHTRVPYLNIHHSVWMPATSPLYGSERRRWWAHELLFKNIFIFWVLCSILDLNFDLTGHGNPTKHTAVSLQMCVCVCDCLVRLIHCVCIRDNGAVDFNSLG